MAEELIVAHKSKDGITISKEEWIEFIKDLLKIWRDRLDDRYGKLRVGRCGEDDGSFSHGEMVMLEECIDDLEDLLIDLEHYS